MLIASAKSCSVRGASHQPAFMGRCLTISHICLPCLPGGGWANPCVLWPLVIELMVVLLTFFFMVGMVLLMVNTVKHCLKIYSSTICIFPDLIERCKISWYCFAVSSVSVAS